MSALLNESTYGYESQGHKINHLFFMDDLKTCAKDDNRQTSLLSIVKKVNNDIKMEFGLDKCAKATFKRGKLTETSDIQIDLGTCSKELDREGTYKYHAVNEVDATMKEKWGKNMNKYEN